MKNRNCPNKDACWDYDASNCEGCAIGQKIEKFARKIKRLQAENSELKATISKMEIVEKKLKARLEKAVELPFGDRVWFITEDEEGKESYIISKPTDRLTVDELYEIGKKYFTTYKAAEARLAELKGGRE